MQTTTTTHCAHQGWRALLPAARLVQQLRAGGDDLRAVFLLSDDLQVGRLGKPTGEDMPSVLACAAVGASDLHHQTNPVTESSGH
jgi:hypothetical protein